MTPVRTPASYSDPTGLALATGPITGTVTLVDGTVYDVTETFIEVPSLEHANEISHWIGLRHEIEGNHPSHQPTDADPYPAPFRHLCTPWCGPARRPDSDPMQAAALVRAALNHMTIADPVQAHYFGQAVGLVDPSLPPPIAMALASTAAENASLNGLDGTGNTNVIPDVSLHTATPGTTGASENANTGSYARQACTWNAAASGSKTNSTSLTFSTAGTVAVTYIGTWSSATYGAGTYAIGAALTSSVTAASITFASGAITLTSS